MRGGKTLLEKPFIKKRNQTRTTACTGHVTREPKRDPIVPISEPISEPIAPESMEQFSTQTLPYRQPIIDGYKGDAQFSKALITGMESGIYTKRDGLLYVQQRLCIPNIKVRGGRDRSSKNLREMLISHHIKSSDTRIKRKQTVYYGVIIIGKRWSKTHANMSDPTILIKHEKHSR